MQSDSGSGALRDLARLLVDSWNRSEAGAFASLFTPGAEYITGAGERFRGRQAIAQLAEKAAPAAQVTMVEEPFVECEARLGRLSFTWSAVEPKGTARRGRITCACVRHEGRWLIASLRNDEVGSVGETPGSRTGS